MFGRIVATVAVVMMVSAGAARADEVGGGPIVVPAEPEVMEVEVVETVEVVEVTVDSAPPPFAVLSTTAVGAGLGLSWGEGILSFEGVQHTFRVKGIALGDLGIARLSGEGDVRGLDRAEDFAGTYVAIGAGAVAGGGGEAVTMRNENGVTLSVRSAGQGARFSAGPQSFTVVLD